MSQYEFKYGNSKLVTEVNLENIIYNLVPKKSNLIKNVKEEVIKSLDNPTYSFPLKQIIKPGENIVIIVSNITRAWIKTSEFLTNTYRW